ncbi:hypothetical protein GCM10011339_09680 [Echinicola rosea]|uniref:Uncharacterized protein n=1 Tax=Echinicola rosea TaxID=1807691 RepID=A0ABQ1US89_9BACT|nr:hypothetical protein GCM10011339_09680 [Echinicola rosea]
MDFTGFSEANYFGQVLLINESRDYTSNVKKRIRYCKYINEKYIKLTFWQYICFMVNDSIFSIRNRLRCLNTACFSGY